jgi:cytochrome c peroxidase
MKLRTKILTVLIISVTIIACTKRQDEATLVSYGEIGPALPTETYSYAESIQLLGGTFPGVNLSSDIITLGRVLFYDKALSFNNSISCGSCHFQDKGFADNVRFHKGVFGNTLKRNTLSITGNNFALFWDGRASSMKDLVLRPIANHDEMVQDPQVLVSRLKQLDYYKALFNKAYNTEEIDLEGIENALAAFCVCILPAKTKFNIGANALFNNSGLVFVDTATNLNNFTAMENKGLNLFYGKAKCGGCHRPEIITGYYGGSPYANIGLDLVYSDNGLGALTNIENNNGKFKIPNIKNIALTAPYMHDGRFNTLEEVVEHYNSGIKANRNLSPRLYQNSVSDLDLFLIEQQNQVPSTVTITPVKLGLNVDEKAALVAFLKTLTDEQLIRDIKFSNPF